MVVVAFAINPCSLSDVLLLLFSIAEMEQLFNKQSRKGESLRETRLTAWDESAAACSRFSSVRTFIGPLS